MSARDAKHIVLSDGGKKIRLRKSLFWDLPANRPDLQKNKKLVIERVFTRGNVEEFQAINRYYSRDEIRKAVLQIGSLDNRTLHFISSVYQLNPDDFLCYKKKQ